MLKKILWREFLKEKNFFLSSESCWKKIFIWDEVKATQWNKSARLARCYQLWSISANGTNKFSCTIETNQHGRPDAINHEAFQSAVPKRSIAAINKNFVFFSKVRCDHTNIQGVYFFQSLNVGCNQVYNAIKYQNSNGTPK